ncbi:cytochrome P450 [Streptomyces canus]|uniref:cytochrome P450 n=1 Tax=Streptomyces canus TaxID=58343 RepID=UPI00369A9FD3
MEPAAEPVVDLPAIPLPQPDILQAPPLAGELREKCPFAKVRTPAGDEAWLVTGYEAIKQVYSDDRFGVSHRDPEHAPRLGASTLIGGPGGNFDTEPEDRMRLRARLSPFFSPKSMEAFRPRMDALVEEVLDDIVAQGPPADLHSELAVRLPVNVICELLGVPREARLPFREWTQGIAGVHDEALSRDCMAKLMSYTGDLVAEKRRNPGDDILSSLCAADDGRLDDRHVSFLAAMLLFAGHETTVARLDLGVLLMLAHPEQREILERNPDRIGSAVEEILRLVVHGGAKETFRYAREDAEFDGVKIKAGELLVLYSAAGNRDTCAFADPESFDVLRSPKPNLTLGFGRHYCLGAPLVRMELAAVFSRIFDKLPGLRLTKPIGALEVNSGSLHGGITELPVTW